MLASSEKRSRPNNTSVIKQNYYKDGRGGAIGNVNSEARSQTAMLLPSKQNSHGPEKEAENGKKSRTQQLSQDSPQDESP